MATTTIDKPSLRLATMGGRAVKRRARPVKPLTDKQAEVQVIGDLRSAISRLPRSSKFRRRLGYLLAELEYEDPEDAF